MAEGSPKRHDVSDLPTQVQRVRSQVPTPQGEAPEIKGFAAGEEVGPYKILGLLGLGGMGVVFRAYQASLQRDVAIKVLSPELVEQEGFVERFNREALSLATLNHPGIVAVIDKGVHEGQYYFVMEYVDGVNLRSMVHERPMDVKPALLIMSRVCEALQYAHSQGYVHRDIKPENVLIDTRGMVKIADFGLAVLADPANRGQRMTGRQALIGTLDYMAPEQRRDSSAVDARADIYSLGVVFYESLTGRLPLGRFSPPSRAAPVDPRLDRIVMKMLDPDPRNRYASASDVAREIGRITASGITVIERAQDEDPTHPYEDKTYNTMSQFLRRMAPMVSVLILFWGSVFAYLTWLSYQQNESPRWTYICSGLILGAIAWSLMQIPKNFYVGFTRDRLVLGPYFRIPWKDIDRFYTQERHPHLLASHVAVLVRYRVGGVQAIRTLIGNPAFRSNSEDVMKALIAYATRHSIPVDEEILAWGWRHDDRGDDAEDAGQTKLSLWQRIPGVTGVCDRTAQFVNFDPYVLRILLSIALIVCGVVHPLRWTAGASIVYLYLAAAAVMPREEEG